VGIYRNILLAIIGYILLEGFTGFFDSIFDSAVKAPFEEENRKKHPVIAFISIIIVLGFIAACIYLYARNN
jgi:hypothetical protein